MRKDVSAGVKSGVISSIPFATYFEVAKILPTTWAIWSSVRVQFPSPVGLWIFVIAHLFIFAVGLVIFGVVAGCIFVFIVNRLPFRSTYVKAIVPSVIFWAIEALSHLFSLTSIIQYLTFVLPNLLFFVLDAVIFSYLFDRWRDPKKTNSLNSPTT